MEMTDTLLSVVRQQRHLSARILISTQEPTTSPKLLDLCNVAIVHRFASPAWYAAIEGHIAGAATARGKRSPESDLFRAIVRLATGEALVFCPTALIGHASGGGHSGDDGEDDGYESLYSSVDDSDTPESVTDSHTESETGVTELGSGHMWLRIRKRVTADGGRSQLQ
ncbi:hypothetical protein PHISP_06410 [Aspergillus sp. HF37]|nr:hypothetical protein PHISP_06410 [Aspergillus sp. HF37]